MMPAAYRATLAYLGGLVFLLLVSGCRDDQARQELAKVLDSYRIFHWTICLESPPPAPYVEPCLRAERDLVEHEPRAEELINSGRGLLAVWTVAKPFVVEAVRYAWGWVPGGWPCPV